MRRKEFEVEDRETCEAFLNERDDGVLTFIGSDGWPKAVPLNYVYAAGNVYFHGSKKGEKMNGIAEDNRAEFVVYEAHAFIPSYYSDPLMACPATLYFRSVCIRGRVEQVEDAEEKATALSALMAKLQPEGGHLPIDAGHPKYAAQLKGVAVLRLDIEAMTGKFKFGQNLSDKKRSEVIVGLEERGRPGDPHTVSFMKEWAPKRN
ncbi:Nitroimidazol reductase NimA, pyridoxamine 5'-phosphate oxidase superfamily [Cohnella sp. OV330]|uniref:pyridoxamine 5'-phosphate oxidase family protein n=1 Tax=Cohnella sp. OV330 TaxID=1855288 RepID=UPI0008EE2875|nr:pyridoxamine 5'-phosphate oxidase family protein [Cohnella sp. OV330]SFA93855.1 Nitroimidazol reductase NimA, pyridoxamine 5'-phosphate oxidase superfamily [Cohnella sp. OV330]